MRTEYTAWAYEVGEPTPHPRLQQLNKCDMENAFAFFYTLCITCACESIKALAQNRE